MQTLPVGEKLLCKFAAHLAMEGLKHRTIKTYMASIQHLHIERVHGDPFLFFLWKLHYVLFMWSKGLKLNFVVAVRSTFQSPHYC